MFGAFMAVIFRLTVLGGSGLLALSIWPGVLEDAVFEFPGFCLSIPFLGCWFLMLVGLALRYCCEARHRNKATFVGAPFRGCDVRHDGFVVVELCAKDCLS